MILVVLLATEKRGTPYAGRTFWRFVFLYGVSRFVIEFFRGDDRGMAGMFSTSQLISLVLVPLSVVMLWWLARSAAEPAGQPGGATTAPVGFGVEDPTGEARQIVQIAEVGRASGPEGQAADGK